MKNNNLLESRIARIASEIINDIDHVIYSAILIDDPGMFVPELNAGKKYGEHITLHYFGKNGGIDTSYAGKTVSFMTVDHFMDEKGEAWTVKCDDPVINELKDPSQMLHVTVCCANGTSPVYSNTLVRNSVPDERNGFRCTGIIAYFVQYINGNTGWIK